FANLAIEGEIAVRLRRDIPAGTGALMDCVESWFPIIELHHYRFRGAKPTAQELVAGNAMHAGFVAPRFTGIRPVVTLSELEIHIEVDGRLAETGNLATI